MFLSKMYKTDVDNVSLNNKGKYLDKPKFFGNFGNFFEIFFLYLGIIGHSDEDADILRVPRQIKIFKKMDFILQKWPSLEA